MNTFHIFTLSLRAAWHAPMSFSQFVRMVAHLTLARIAFDNESMLYRLNLGQARAIYRRARTQKSLATMQKWVNEFSTIKAN